MTRRQSACLTVELELHSVSSKLNSRAITHDIPVKIISLSKISLNDYQEPSVNRTTLSIQLPPLKLLKHMIERMKCLSEFVYLEATHKGTLTLKIEADSVSVSTYFKNLTNLPVNENQKEKGDGNEIGSNVRLSLKRLSDMINALQFQPSRIICNFVNNRYAHFFVIHEEDLILQFLISSVLA